MSWHRDDYLNAAKGAWSKFYTFCDEHRKLTLGVVCVIAGIIIAKVWL